jgi:hypothetical protein
LVGEARPEMTTLSWKLAGTLDAAVSERGCLKISARL